MTIIAGFVIFYAIISRFDDIFVMLDIFTDKHNHTNDQPMRLRKTHLGGLFTLIFLMIAIMFASTNSIYFLDDNIIEVKSMIPLIALEDKENIKSDELTIIIKLE